MNFQKLNPRTARLAVLLVAVGMMAFGFNQGINALDENNNFYFLEIQSAQGSIGGWVNTELGAPLQATVIAINLDTGAKYRVVSSEVYGYYKIIDMEPGKYLIIAWKQYYEIDFKSIILHPGEDVFLNFKLKPKVRVEKTKETLTLTR